ncbi:MAG: DMT family transporter [Lautropia sp.]|nr:DMT family transporter [Lautropia sp.]
MTLLNTLVALLAGVGLATQAAVNARLSAGIGNQPLLAALISFTLGTLILLAIALFQADWKILGSNLGQQPWWHWTGGPFGAFFVTGMVLLAPRIGIANTMFLVLLGQLCTALAIDTFGLLHMPARPVHWYKLVGLAIMIGGLSLFMFGERWFGHQG